MDTNHSDPARAEEFVLIRFHSWLVSRRSGDRRSNKFMNTLRWGILSTANIAVKNWKAIRHSGSSVVAVASRERERSRRFIDTCQAEAPFERAPAALEGYDAMLASKS